MPRVTAVFRMPYISAAGEILTGQMESTRWKIVDKQLEALYSFLGDGIISGWEIEKTPNIPLSITITPGSGVVSGIAAASSDNTILENLVPGTVSGNTTNFLYAKLLGHTPYTAQVDFVSSTVFYDSAVYLKLGKVIVDAQKKIVSIDMSESSGRKNLSFVNFVLSIVKEHLHTGAPTEPSKIDLQNHVKGILDSSHIGNISASKITGGFISPDRFKLSHKDLQDVGTLTHEEIDSLIEKLQNINRLLFGDIMTSNLMQLYLSFKHIWPEVDEFAQNFIAIIPGIGNNKLLNPNSFIDLNATTAEIDFTNHRIRGKSLAAKELAQTTINTLAEWNSGEFNSSFVRILDTGSAYGYGYGYGEGLDFFDVFQTSDFNFLTGTDQFISFSGNQTGYGADDFETVFAGQYSYGYGYEYVSGFPNTLTTTLVTLNPLSQTLNIHDEKLSENESGGNDYIASDVNSGFFVQKDLIPDGTTKAAFIKNLGKDIATTASGRRSTSIDPFNNGINNIPDDLYSFYSFKVSSGADGQITDSDRATVYVVWDNPVDMTINNVITFRVVQAKDGEGNLTTFDENWTFDHSFQLILEATDDTHRAYYLYKTTNSTNRFFVGDEYTNQNETAPLGFFGTKYFQSLGEFIDGKHRFELAATITSDSLEFVTAFNKSTEVTVNNPFTFTTLIQKITGIILYTDTIFGHDNKQQNNLGATFVKLPQGRRERLQFYPGFDPSARMLADIDKIFIGGPFGFGDDADNNDIVDLIVSFPDRVDFNSISWISDEPGDSIVWIQVNRLEEDSANDYRTEPIYSNNVTRASSIFPSSEIRGPGEDFTDIFKNIRGIRMRVVLLPTTDKRVAPTISSISVNYSSNTLSSSLTITSFEDWQNARSVKNLKLTTDGTVYIDLPTTTFGKVQNIFYGTDRSVVEVNNDFNTVVKRYNGSNLPLTVTQQLNNRPTGLSGAITDLKKMREGDIVLLDRDESRIVYLDQNYNLKKIISSERVFFSNMDVGAGAAGDTATLVKAIYNRELSDDGILYLVFSHQLAAYPSPNNTNVKPSQMFIKSKGQTIDLSSISVSGDSVIACDRGILSLKLDSTIANFIESAVNPVFQIRLDSNPAVIFAGTTTVTAGRIDMPIVKIGSKGIFSSYNLIYAPIQGVVAFDIDNDLDILHLLKSQKPYSWDTDSSVDNVWYARFSVNRFWTSWNSSDSNSALIDPNIETNINTIRGTESDPSLVSPNFFINNFFGYKGSLQRFGDWMLITLCGDKKVFITKKDDSTEGVLKFRQPTTIDLPEDGTTPMAARLDPLTTTADDFNFVYVALSDLRRGTTDKTGESKIVKIQVGVVPSQMIIWTWGSGSDERTTQAVSCNDIRPLLYTDAEGVFVST